MQIFEVKLKDIITIRHDDIECSHMDTEGSYVFSLSIWFILPILILLVLNSIIPSSIGNWMRQARDWKHQTLGLFKSFSLMTIVHWAARLYNRWFSSSKSNAFNESILQHFSISPTRDRTNRIDNGPAEETERTLTILRGENEYKYSEAYKYLCTCKPGSKILARKPLRMDYV